jgi:hypothetical protein
MGERLRAQAERKAIKREDKKETDENHSPTEPKVRLALRHTVETQELLMQAELVAEKSETAIPDAIVKAVERAIQARKRCAA